MTTDIGLRDKLYWRLFHEGEGLVWHCFKKAGKKRYLSLCGQFTRRTSGGQSCQRPRAELRCARCDGLEMLRRGREESMPPSPTRTA